MAEGLLDSYCSSIRKRVLAEQAQEAWIAEHSAESWQYLLHELDDEDDPQARLAQLGIEELFQACRLSPITENAQNPTAETIALEEHARQSADIPKLLRSFRENLEPNIIPEEEFEAKRKHEKEAAAQHKKNEERKIYRKIKRRLARRKSDVCFLNMPLKQYLTDVERLAAMHKAEQDSAEPRDSEQDWSESQKSIRKQVNEFTAWALDKLGQLCGATTSTEPTSAEEEANVETARGQPPPT